MSFLNTIGTQIAPALASAALAVLVALIGAFGDAAVKFIKAKKDAVAQKIGVETYNSNLAIAREVWGIVDEHFRIDSTIQKTVESASALFEQEILKIIPGLTKDEIEHLRQAVAGEVNKGRAVIVSDETTEPESTVDTTAQDAAQAEALAETQAAEKLNQLKAAALALNITVTDDMDVSAVSNAIQAALVA